MLRAWIVAAIALAAGVAAVIAQRAPPVPTPGAEDLLSNVMIAGFDRAAGLRAAQAARDPAERIEELQRPGLTALELDEGGRRVRALLRVDRLPKGLDLTEWPATALIGAYSSSEPNDVVSAIELRVDGCAIALPMTGVTGCTDPRSVELGRDGRLWTLRISNDGDSEAYTATYSFDDRSVVAQQVDWSGSSTDARLKIDEEDFGAGRDCTKVGARTSGARAELKAGSRP